MFSGWVLRVLGALAALLWVAGVLLLAVDHLHPRPSVTGQVVASGGGTEGCYPTVHYVVDGRDLRFTAARDQDSCTLDLGGPAQVWYDAGDPADARLTQVGPWAGRLGAAGLAASVVLVGLAARQGARGRPGTLRRVAWLPAVGLVGVCLAAVACGDRPGSLDALTEQIARGHVDTVEVAGALEPGERGTSQVQLRWDAGWPTRTARVLQASDPRGPRRPGQVAPVLVGDLRDALAERAGVDAEGLRIVEVARFLPPPRPEPGPGLHVDVRLDRAEVLGFRIPPPWGWLYGASALAVLLILLVGPQPRRATRWAWFWLLLAPWFGVLVGVGFLAAGGALTGSGGAPEESRLGGGRAFLGLIGLAILAGLLAGVLD